MKKALAILLALSMVFAAFADAPAADFSVVSFSGNAALEWVSDLDGEKNGFNNTTEAAVKINLFNAGDAATSGEGVWGELKIVTDKDGFYEVKDGSALAAGLTTPPLYAKVDTAKIHFVDGDVGIALNILKPGLTLGENVLPTAVGKDKDNDAWKSLKLDVTSYAPAADPIALAKAKAELAVAQKAYDEKVEDYNEEVQAWEIAGSEEASKPSDKDTYCATEKATLEAKEAALAALDKSASALKAGFGLEITSSVIDANFKVMDNGVAKDKEWGFGADATIKAVENLNVKAGFAYAFEKTAFLASVDYKLAIDEKLYVKPAVVFGTMDETKELAASALFGWGTEGQEPDFIKDGLKDKDGNDTRFIPNKCADGFSVTFTTNMADPAVNSISFGLYDSTLLEGLKVGAAYGAKLDAFGEGTLSLAAKYGTDIDILTIALDFGFRTTFGTEKSSLYAYAVEVSTDDVIDNTKLYAKYESLTKQGADTAKGKITVGAKISL